MSPRKTCHIAVLASRRGHYGRTILRGICDFARLHPNCQFSVLEASPETIPFIRERRPDGMIAYLNNPDLVASLSACDLPIINVSNWLEGVDLPRVGLADRRIGQLAAEHLLARGFQRFGFVGTARAMLSARRAEGFAHALSEAGYEFDQYTDQLVSLTKRTQHWSAREQNLSEWVRSLPKPVAIFAFIDEAAFEIVEVCRLSGLRVPEQVAVLGVDDDPLWCDLCVPPLSSIQIPAEEVGFKAAQLMERWIGGNGQPERIHLYPPHGVTTRQSTDVLAVDDPALSRALRYIRENAHHPISVNDVRAQVSLSRRALERRFVQALDRTPLDEILRVRLELAQKLLSSSDLSVGTVASRCGFTSPERFSVVFRRKIGMPPSDYRATFRRS